MRFLKKLKKKNKKAFTLIELLAVIIILAIIALIATPIITKLINTAKEQTIIRSAENYDDAILNSVIRAKLSNGEVKLGEYKVNSDGNISKDGKTIIVETKGNIPDNGSTLILGNNETNNDINIISAEFYFENITVTKDSGHYIISEIDSSSGNVTVSFASDSWNTIKKAVKRGNTSNYRVGDTKIVDMGSFGKHTLRIANKSECTNGETSETACGFVLEFTDIITKHNMNSFVNGRYSNIGGWKDSDMRAYIKETIYNALPSDLQSVIADTTVVSGYGTKDSSNFTTTDKLYLLSSHEVWRDDTNCDTAYNQTRQLDYYKNLGVTLSNYSKTIKQYNGSNTSWWLRTANSKNYECFHSVGANGSLYNPYSTFVHGISPAFRIK